MENILLIILSVVAGWFMCLFYLSYKVNQWLNEEQENNVSTTEEVKQTSGSIEQHGDVLYLFNKDTNAFLCQGYNVNELAKRLLDYKKVKIAHIEFGNKIYYFINGEVREAE